MLWFIGAAMCFATYAQLRMAWRLRRAEMAVLEMLAMPVGGTRH